MPIHGQKINRIKISQLKGLRDVEIDLSGNLTGIMARNGEGKSTILYALACINRQPASNVASIYHFKDFFPPTTHGIWAGSSFETWQDYSDTGNPHNNVHTSFRKDIDRWAPRINYRIERYVAFIGIKSAVPHIETETQTTRIHFTPTVAVANSIRVLNVAGVILNRNYTTYTRVLSARKTYLEVTLNGILYSSLSMGAGEQRIFQILNIVLNAPNNALILIDEIDILLHQDALMRLLAFLNTEAQNRHLQIIFTTHSQSVLGLSVVNFRHILQTPAKTLCFDQTKPEVLERLTGTPQRPIEMFVEDEVAKGIVKKVAASMGLARFLSVKKFGAATNCFTSIGGAILKNDPNLNNMLFVLDGDVYRTANEKENQIRRVLSGDDPVMINHRTIALQKITEFVLPIGAAPEHYYHQLICELNDAILTPEELEIVQAARNIHNVQNTHLFFNDIFQRMDFEYAVGIDKVIDLLFKSPEWGNITLNISNWLIAKQPELI